MNQGTSVEIRGIACAEMVVRAISAMRGASEDRSPRRVTSRSSREKPGPGSGSTATLAACAIPCSRQSGVVIATPMPIETIAIRLSEVSNSNARGARTPKRLRCRSTCAPTFAVPHQAAAFEDFIELELAEFGGQVARNDQQIRFAIERKPFDVVEILHRVACDGGIDGMTHQRFRMRAGKARPRRQAQRHRTGCELLDHMSADRAGVGIDKTKAQVDAFRQHRGGAQRIEQVAEVAMDIVEAIGEDATGPGRLERPAASIQQRDPGCRLGSANRLRHCRLGDSVTPGGFQHAAGLGHGSHDLQASEVQLIAHLGTQLK